MLGQNADPASAIKLLYQYSPFLYPCFPPGLKAALCSVEHCWHLVTETIKAFTLRFPDLQHNIMPCDLFFLSSSQFMMPILLPCSLFR